MLHNASFVRVGICDIIKTRGKKGMGRHQDTKQDDDDGVSFVSNGVFGAITFRFGGVFEHCNHLRERDAMRILNHCGDVQNSEGFVMPACIISPQ